MRSLIDRATRLVGAAPGAADIAVRDLRERSRRARAAELDPATILLTEVLTGLAHCWECGWQPLDIVHVIRRRGTTPAAGWAASAIIQQAQRSGAFDRAPQEWLDQLDSLPALPVGLSATSGESVWMSALLSLGLLRRLPSIQVLIAPPSSWGREHTTTGPVRRRPSSAGPGADAKLLTRVRALLAKAESTDFPAEAEAFTAKAQALMTRHAIDEALVHAEAGGSIDVFARRVHIDNPYALQKANLLHQVADANRVSAIWSEYASHVTLVGVAVDLEQVEMSFTSLLVQATRAMTDAGASASSDGRSRSRSYRSTFLIAYATRIGQRLTLASSSAAAGYGSALVPVFAQQEKAVDDERTRLFPHVTTRTGTRTHDRQGWHAGTRAADDAVLPAGRVEA